MLCFSGLRSTGGSERRVSDREVPSLYKLMEEHDDEALTRIIHVSDTLQGQQGGSNFMEVANSVRQSLHFCYWGLNRWDGQMN